MHDARETAERASIEAFRAAAKGMKELRVSEREIHLALDAENGLIAHRS